MLIKLTANFKAHRKGELIDIDVDMARTLISRGVGVLTSSREQCKVITNRKGKAKKHLSASPKDKMMRSSSNKNTGAT